MGEWRFNVGAVQKITAKTSYPCSLAIHTRLFSAGADHYLKRLEHKEELAGHYSYEYVRQTGENGTIEKKPTSGSPDQFVGSKRPFDHWEFEAHDRLYSFYAGKVIYAFVFRSRVDAVGFNKYSGIPSCPVE